MSTNTTALPKNKITPTLRRAVINEAAVGRVAILKPIFEGEDASNIEVLEVLKATDKKKFGYDLHHVDGLMFDAESRFFTWEHAEGHYSRGYGGGGYFTVDAIITKKCKCIPLRKTEDLRNADVVSRVSAYPEPYF
jgi:hypothetical protein